MGNSLVHCSADSLPPKYCSLLDMCLKQTGCMPLQLDVSLYSIQYITSLPLYCIDTSVLLLQSIVSQLLLAVGCQSQCLTSGLLCDESCWSGNCRAACKTATLDNVRVDILMRSFFKLRCASSKDLHPQLPSEVGCPLPIPNV